MRRELFAQAGVRAELVGMDRAVTVNVNAHDRLQVLASDVRNVEGAHLAATLDQRKDFLLVVHPALHLATTATAPIGLVGFNDFSAAAELASRFRLHASAKAMRHEPRGFVRHAKHTLKLLAGNAFLGRANQMVRVNPLVERNLGIFKHGPNRHGVLGTAMAARQKASTHALGWVGLDAVLAIRAAAVRAYRAFGPADILKVRAGVGFVVEAFLGVSGGFAGQVFGLVGHGFIPQVRP